MQTSKHRQLQCNFCQQPFISETPTQNSIHLCLQCIERAANTTCFKVSSPDGKTWYQLQLYKNNLNVYGVSHQEANEDKAGILEDIDMFRDRELKDLAAKWGEISSKIEATFHISEEEASKYRDLFQKSIASQLDLHCSFRLQIEELLRVKSQEAQVSKFKTPNKKDCVEELDEQFSPIKNTQFYGLNDRKSKPVTQHKQFALSSKRLKEGKENDKQNNNINRTSKSRKGIKDDGTEPNNHLKSHKKLNNCSNKKGQNKVESQGWKRWRDLQIIAQDALKGKIYHYLESQAVIPPALYLLMTLKIYDALKNTATLNKCVELVSYDISGIDFGCYLRMLEWSNIEVLKLVKVGLSDAHFAVLVNFLIEHKIDTVVVSNNNLSERSCVQMFEKGELKVRNLYMGRNKIKKYKAREEIKKLQSLYNIYL